MVERNPDSKPIVAHSWLMSISRCLESHIRTSSPVLVVSLATFCRLCGLKMVVQSRDLGNTKYGWNHITGTPLNCAANSRRLPFAGDLPFFMAWVVLSKHGDGESYWIHFESLILWFPLGPGHRCDGRHRGCPPVVSGAAPAGGSGALRTARGRGDQQCSGARLRPWRWQGDAKKKIRKPTDSRRS